MVRSGAVAAMLVSSGVFVHGCGDSADAGPGGKASGGSGGKAGAATGGSGGFSAAGGSGGMPDCYSSADCPAQQECSGGRCVAYQGCQTDADCADGQTCVGSVCRASCESDPDCAPLGLICDPVTGVCLPLAPPPPPQDASTLDGSPPGDAAADNAPPPPNDSLIDDLEDGDASIASIGGRVGKWYVFHDDRGSMSPPKGTWQTASPGAASTQRCAHASGNGFNLWGAGIAVDLANPGDSTTSPLRKVYDTSAYDGFSFWAKGKGSIRFKVVTRAVATPDQQGTCSAGDKCFDSHGVDIHLSADWKEYRVLFSSLQQEGWGQIFAFNSKEVFGIAFQHINVNTDFDFWVDTVKLIEQTGGGGNPGDAGGGGTPGQCVGNLGGYANGSATLYWLDQGSTEVNCSYAIQGRNPDVVAHVATGAGKYFAAMNTSDYATAAACGACVEVTRDGNRKVVVTVVDQCPVGTNPKCKSGHIDLSREAFRQIGTDSEGYLGTGNGGAVGQIAWKYVPCPTTETVSFRLKEPSNQYWNSVLVQGHRYPIKSVQVRVGSSYVNATRQEYNYWLPPGGNMGSAPYQVRVTDVNGASLEASLTLKAGDQGGGQQFACQ